MFRVIGFLVIVGLLAVLAIWISERPGAVAVTWMGYRIETSVAVGALVIALFGLFVALLWSGLRLIWRSPRIAARALRARRANKGRLAVSRGLVALASGDAQAARKYSAAADRSGGDDPLVLLLRAQTAQLSGNRAGAEHAFRAMTQQDETRLLGLRGLFVEAQRQGNMDSARRFAQEAAQAAPALAWAGQAVFESYCAEADWASALRALETQMRNGLVDRAKHRRLRAVLLTAQAYEAEESQPAQALAMASEAAKLTPGLVPAAVLAARLGAGEGDWRKGAKLLEAAWREHPHPDIAELYAHLRPGGSARDRLARVQHLTRQSGSHPESALARARAALEAQDFTEARKALAMLLARPTRRVALLMGELERTESGDEGRAREWIARAVRAAPDPAWTADGIVSERWLPASPVSGRLDAFEWKVPLSQISHSGATLEAMPLSEREARVLAAPAPPPAPEPVHVEPIEEAAVEEEVARVQPDPAAAAPSEPPPSAAVPEKRPGPALEIAATNERPAAAPTSAPAARPAPPRSRPELVIPLVHAPDDPGPEPDAPEAPSERPLVLP